MMKKVGFLMGFFMLASVACVARAQDAPRGQQLDALEQAFARRDYPGAAELINSLIIARRPLDGALRPDPLLNGLIGRFYLITGQTEAAIAYLSQTMDGAPAPQRIEAALALAEAQALFSQRENASATRARLEREPLSPDQRQRLILASLAETLVDDPRAALSHAAALETGDARYRFEAAILAGQAHSLLGDRTAAFAAADRAWALAPTLPEQQFAPLRATLLRAGLAAAASDRDQQLAMLNLAGASEAGMTGEIGTYLPTCGEGGLGPADYLTFAAYGADLAWERLMPVAASRPAAVAPFVRALGGRQLLVRSRQAPGGLVVTVRCRTTPARGGDNPPTGDSYARFFAEHGIYPALSQEWDPDRIATLERQIAEIEGRLGRDHPSLIPMFVEIQQRIEGRLAETGTADLSGAAEINRRLLAAVRRLPGSEPLLPTAAEEAAMASTTPATAEAVYRDVLTAYIARTDADFAYPYVRAILKADQGIPGPVARALIESLIARLPAEDRRRRGLFMRLGKILDDMGETAAARAAYRRARLPADACELRYPGLTLAEGSIGADSYPMLATRYDLTATTIIEYGVDAEGRVASQRMVVSAPAGLFDEAATRAFGTYRYRVEGVNGRLQPCGGDLITITWRLPDVDTDSRPDFDLFGLPDT